MYYDKSRFPLTLRWIIGVNLVIWLLQVIPGIGTLVTGALGLSPELAIHGQIWRFFTYGFIHSPSSFFHLFFNMFGLWMFGVDVIEVWGERKFLIFYLAAIIFSGVLSLLYLPFNPALLIMGASGAVLAVSTLYALFYPHRELLFWGIIPIKAWILTVLFAILTVGSMISGDGSVAHLTHLGGIVFALLWFRLEPMIVRLSTERPIKRKKTIIHYFEPRPSRRELISEKQTVDDVLKKVSLSGMNSLTEEEIKILEKASGKPIPR